MKLLEIIGIVAGLSTAAYANAPLPGSYFGLDTIAINSNQPYNLYACSASGCGGEFTAVVTAVGNGLLSAPSFATSLWCVDSQEGFSWGDSGLANVVSMADVTGNSHVRYSALSNFDAAAPNIPHWTTTGSLPSSAALRFEMAAWLIKQYSQDSRNNDAVQNAIWDITSNSTYPDGVFPGAADGALVNRAQMCYNMTSVSCGTAIDPDSWAIVSWTADANGNLSASGNNRQTFLAEVSGLDGSSQNGATPEPGFYGLLSAGLAGLFLAMRKRNKRQATNLSA